MYWDLTIPSSGKRCTSTNTSLAHIYATITLANNRQVRLLISLAEPTDPLQARIDNIYCAHWLVRHGQVLGEWENVFYDASDGPLPNQWEIRARFLCQSSDPLTITTLSMKSKLFLLGHHSNDVTIK